VGLSLTRRQLLGVGLAGAGALALGGRRARAIGEGSRFRFARLELATANPDPRPTALRKLAWEIEKRTSIEVDLEPRPVRLDRDPLHETPFLYLAGDREVQVPDPRGVDKLRRYLTYGGFLLIDSAEGRAGGGFDESVRRLLAQTLPGELPARIPDEHVLWKSFYVLRGAPGRILAAPYVEGVERDRRLAVVYTQNDLEGALARDGFGRWEHEVIPGGDEQREQAFRFGVNLVMYALCLDYKTEQAHIDYILRTRRLSR